MASTEEKQVDQEQSEASNGGQNEASKSEVETATSADACKREDPAVHPLVMIAAS